MPGHTLEKLKLDAFGTFGALGLGTLGFLILAFETVGFFTRMLAMVICRGSEQTAWDYGLQESIP